ncbi:glycoside hydrolase family 32 protein [Propioniciclava sp.]|uniref:glycoside hydrolase family 32 protein n=1 Tax=Propioniciclava sp. TaxID=2038686 RepID=UPI0026211240|nr:glycoside hydrolase family 32 protein [Propioniciclava sp.]
MAHPTPQYRPEVHFTPRDTWMNDPNGLIRHDGIYHLYFQNNPEGDDWGNIGWGHATSIDLIDWCELPVAIPATDQEMAFSGSAVWDRANTSGLGEGPEGPLVALYTSHSTPDHPEHPHRQAQALAWSNDDGLTWTRYPGNPVLDRGSKEFRDPKVFWHEETGRWVMVAVEADRGELLVHSSADLIAWRFESSFRPNDVPGCLWECPDLVRVPVEGTDAARWVLLLSTNPAGFAGGSGMRYWVGDFDGHTFTPDEHHDRWFDFGPDMYAAVSFQGTDEPTVIGWMSNWAYARHAPTRPWRSAMTLARTLSLVETSAGPRLRQRPVLPEPRPGVVQFGFTFDGPGEVRLEWSGPEGPTSAALRRLSCGSMVFDRSDADPHGVHAGSGDTPPIPVPEGAVSGFLVEDHGLVEVFLDDGLVSVTAATFPGTGPARVTLAGAVRPA